MIPLYVLEEDIYTETKLVDVVSAFGNMLVKMLGESIPRWIEKMKPALSTLGELVIKSAVPKIDVSSVIPSLKIGNAMSAQMEQIRKQYQVMGKQMNVVRRLESAGNQMAIAAARQNVIYNNSMLSTMGDLSPISKMAYTPAMNVARELSERNQRFANSLGLNRMSGESVDTDKEDDDKEKDVNA